MRKVWPLVVCAVMALALRDSVWTVDPQRGIPFDLDLAHQNGLRVQRPAGFIEIEMADGYVLSELSDDPVPMEIRLQKLAKKPGAYRASRRNLSWLTGDATYVITDRMNSEMGVYYELKAFRPDGNDWLLITATAKGDWREPDFAVAWALLDQALLVPPDPVRDTTDETVWHRLWSPEICQPQPSWRNQDDVPAEHRPIKPAYYDRRC